MVVRVLVLMSQKRRMMKRKALLFSVGYERKSDIVLYCRGREVLTWNYGKHENGELRQPRLFCWTSARAKYFNFIGLRASIKGGY